MENSSTHRDPELWTENFDALLALVKEYIISLWEARKVEVYRECYG